VMSVGRDAGGIGNLTVDHSAINLSGQQTASPFFGAQLAIGNLGGTGSASITNGSTVTISNAGSSGAHLFVGGTAESPGGSGSLSVTNSQISVLGAAPPAGVAGQIPRPGSANVIVGYDGTGTVTLNNSTLQVGNPVTLHDGGLTLAGGDGALIVASQPGSTGVLSLNNGSLVKAGYIGIGVSQPGVVLTDGSVIQSNGGAGHLIVNNSTINTTTLEIGSQGILSGDGGVINAAGGVIVGGTINPGNSPGRINIHCDLTFLAGSKLILDIQDNGDGGFNVDHLILGPEANFGFENVQVDFNFLGNTDPTAFLNSGGFNLDSFIDAGDLDNFTPLAGAKGVAWSELFSANQFIATADQGVINNFVFTPSGANGEGGSVTFTTAAVPEVSTWLMMALGLLLLAAATRNRQRTGRARL
jgi:hypothetical protein